MYLLLQDFFLPFEKPIHFYVNHISLSKYSYFDMFYVLHVLCVSSAARLTQFRSKCNLYFTVSVSVNTYIIILYKVIAAMVKLEM